MSSGVCREQVQGLLKLVGEAFELANEPEARRQHLLVGLTSLFHARLGASVVDTDFQPGGRGNMILLGVHEGGSHSDLARFATMHLERGPSVHPVVAAAMSRPDAQCAGGVLTVRRADAIEARAWHESEFVRDCLHPCGYGEPLLTFRGTGKKHEIQGLAFHRASKDRSFRDEDRNLLHMFMESCSSLFGDWSPTRDEQLVATLTPRQRDTFDCLLAGQSEKEIATSLALSPHTVHVYAKAIYRLFGVRSRAELMSRFVRRPRKIIFRGDR